MLSSKTKALAFSLGCLVIELGAWVLLAPNSTTALPHSMFYLILIVNTYFSIEIFSKFSVSLDQKLLDAIIAVTYFFLALSIGRPTLFQAIATALFALATIKYVVLSRGVHRGAVRR